MSHYRLAFVAAAVLAFFLGSRVLTQPGQGRDNGIWMYDTETEATLTGIVGALEEIAPGEGLGGLGGLYLTLNTATRSIRVHVGPLMYLQETGLRIDKGDQLTILGSRITLDEEPLLIARQITKDDQTVTLRDKSGRPLWARGPWTRQSR